MGYSVRYNRMAEKYLDSQTTSTRKRIMDAIENLPDGNIRKLKGREGYRLTIGGFRVLFNYIGNSNSTIEVVAIGPRGDIYK